MLDNIRNSIYRKFREHEYKVLFNRISMGLSEVFKEQVVFSNTVLCNVGATKDFGYIYFLIKGYNDPRYMLVKAVDLGRENASICIYNGHMIKGVVQLKDLDNVSTRVKENVDPIVKILEDWL